MRALNTRAEELLEAVGLTGFAATPAGELPYGRKRALEIATTLALDPEMMLLDEPTAGMTHADVERITALIGKVAVNRTVLMVEHNLSVVSTLSHHITVLARGEILAQGDYASVSKNPEVHPGLSRGRAWLRAQARRPLLAVRGLNAWYGESHILHGVEFDVASGEVVTLLGRNGAGKTTTMKSIMGIVGRREGSVLLDGTETDTACPRTGSPALGIALCPEERAIFSSLNVEENLLLPPKVQGGRAQRRADLQAVSKSARSASPARAPSSPAASSRCWRSGAYCVPAPVCCCSTSRPRGSRPVIVQQIGRTIARAQDARVHDPAGRTELSFRGNRR